MSRDSGITLIEIMVVLIIVGILAAMAMPMFPRAIESTKAKEAVTALQQIRTGERIYRVEENTYWQSSGAGDETEIDQINKKIRSYLDLRDNRNWNYSVGVATTQAFTATATRKSGGAQYKDKTITIDQDGSLGGTWPPELLPGE